MTLASFHKSALLFALIIPVNNKISFISVNCLNVLICCWHNGFVGEIKRIFESGNLFNLSNPSNKAIAVFPVPVGKTTNVLLFLHVSKTFNWYSLGVKLIKLNIIIFWELTLNSFVKYF